MFKSMFPQWFKNLGQVDGVLPENEPKDFMATLPVFNKELRLEFERDHQERRGDFFKNLAIEVSKERKTITPDDFRHQLDALLEAKEAHASQMLLAHQNPATTKILAQSLREEISKMMFLAFDSPSLTPEEADARYQKYLAETTVPENEPPEEPQ